MLHLRDWFIERFELVYSIFVVNSPVCDITCEGSNKFFSTRKRVSKLQRLDSSIDRARINKSKLVNWLRNSSLGEAIVLTTPSSVSWITGGKGPLVDRSSSQDDVWVAIDTRTAVLITTEVEIGRIEDEFRPKEHGFDEIVSVPWYEQQKLAEIAQSFLGKHKSELMSDANNEFGVNVSRELVTLRLELNSFESQDLQILGMDACVALETGLSSWKVGESDYIVQARISAELERRGMFSQILIVGGDERVARYRHPLAVGAPMSKMVMGVVVAVRDGLHVACTRYVRGRKLESEFLANLEKVRRIDAKILDSCKPGNTYGEVLETMDRAYALEGFPNGWSGHYQGGPIGYEQREFEIAPSQSESPWYSCAVRASHAIAWNPSLPGGAKVEDTYLISDAGLEPVTRSPDWPIGYCDQRELGYPEVLLV